MDLGAYLQYILTAAGGAFTAWLTFRSQQKKTGVDRDAAIDARHEALFNRLENAIAAAEKRERELEVRVDMMTKLAFNLHASAVASRSFALLLLAEVKRLDPDRSALLAEQIPPEPDPLPS